jgi:cytidylate kinase
MTRELNPLIKAEGAVEISTDDHSIEEMTEIIKSYVVKKK